MSPRYYLGVFFSILLVFSCGCGTEYIRVKRPARLDLSLVKRLGLQVDGKDVDKKASEMALSVLSRQLSADGDYDLIDLPAGAPDPKAPVHALILVKARQTVDRRQAFGIIKDGVEEVSDGLGVSWVRKGPKLMQSPRLVYTVAAEFRVLHMNWDKDGRQSNPKELWRAEHGLSLNLSPEEAEEMGGENAVLRKLSARVMEPCLSAVRLLPEHIPADVTLKIPGLQPAMVAGDFDTACDFIHREFHGRNPNIEELYALALCYEALGKKDTLEEARRLIGICLDRAPKNPKYIRSLKRLRSIDHTPSPDENLFFKKPAWKPVALGAFPAKLSILHLGEEAGGWKEQKTESALNLESVMGLAVDNVLKKRVDVEDFYDLNRIEDLESLGGETGFADTSGAKSLLFGNVKVKVLSINGKEIHRAKVERLSNKGEKVIADELINLPVSNIQIEISLDCHLALLYPTPRMLKSWSLSDVKTLDSSTCGELEIEIKALARGMMEALLATQFFQDEAVYLDFPKIVDARLLAFCKAGLWPEALARYETIEKLGAVKSEDLYLKGLALEFTGDEVGAKACQLRVLEGKKGFFPALHSLRRLETGGRLK